MPVTQAQNIASPLNRTARANTAARSASQSAARAVRTVVVASGKGGVGKTQLAVNLAITLGTRGRHVLLVDANPGLGNADVALNIKPEYGLDQLVKGKVPVEEIMSKGPANVRLVAASRTGDDIAGLPPWQRERVARELAAAAAEGFDYVIIDTAAGAHAGEQWLTLLAPEVVIVTTAEPASLADAYAALKTRIAETNTSPDEPCGFSVLVNMANPLEASRAYRALAQTAQRFLKVVPAYLGHVPVDDSVGTASRRRLPFVLEYADCPAARAVWIIAASLEHGKTGIRSFTGR